MPGVVCGCAPWLRGSGHNAVPVEERLCQSPAGQRMGRAGVCSVSCRAAYPWQRGAAAVWGE